MSDVEIFTQRTAQCTCGTLKVTVTSEPLIVVACHCVDCQRRTGAVFDVGAYYKEEQP